MSDQSRDRAISREIAAPTSVAKQDLTESEKAFLRTEFDALRREIDTNQKQRFSLVISSAVICGAIFSWFATNKPPDQIRFIVFLPSAIMFLLACLDLLLRRDVTEIAKYIMKTEKLLAPDERGWEHELADNSSTRSWSGLWNLVWWLAMVIGSATLSWLMQSHL